MGPLSHLGGVPALAAPLFAFCFSGAASTWSCCRFRPSSLFRCLVPFRALPSWVRDAVGVRLPLLCLLVFLPLCCAPLCGWALLLVFCLFGVCRLPPACFCFPSPRGWSCVVPWPSLYAGPSLWVSGCICDGLVALLFAGSVAVLCCPHFTLPHGSKGLWPCVGCVAPSPPCCKCC